MRCTFFDHVPYLLFITVFQFAVNPNGDNGINDNYDDYDDENYINNKNGNNDHNHHNNYNDDNDNNYDNDNGNQTIMIFQAIHFGEPLLVKKLNFVKVHRS